MYICCCVLCFYCCSPMVVFVYRCFVFYGNNILIFCVKICIVIFFVCCIVFCCNNIYVCSVITMWYGIAIKTSSETEIFFLGTIDITLHKPFPALCPPSHTVITTWFMEGFVYSYGHREIFTTSAICLKFIQEGAT